MGKLGEKAAAARAANPVGKDYSEALARGLAVLTAFGPEARSLSLSDIARRLDMPRATVRRALLTLVQLGFAEEESRQFRLTPRVLHLAGAYLGSSIASSVLQPACELLMTEFAATFSVAVLDGDSAMMIAYATPRRIYMDGAGIGLRIPAYCSAVGRVLLAGLPAAEKTRYFSQLKPQPVTPRTVTSKAAIRELVGEVERVGFAIVEDEAEFGFRSLAVPIRGRNGAVKYALNVGMPVQTVPLEEMRMRFLSRLMAEAVNLQPKML